MIEKPYELLVRAAGGLMVSTLIDPATFIVPRVGEYLEAQGPRHWVGGIVNQVKHVHDWGECTANPKLVIKLEPSEVKQTPLANVGQISEKQADNAARLREAASQPDGLGDQPHRDDDPLAPRVKRKRPRGPGGKAAA